MFFELMISQGCKACATFVDIDPQSRDRAIKAGLRAREHYEDQITVKFANQMKLSAQPFPDPEEQGTHHVFNDMAHSACRSPDGGLLGNNLQ